MVLLNITIQGLQENITNINKVSNSLKTELQKSMNVIGDKGVKEFQNEAHVVTGKMKRGIQKGRVTYNNLEIVSQEKYAEFENRRGGAHAFIDKGAKKIEKIAEQELNNATTRVMK